MWIPPSGKVFLPVQRGTDPGWKSSQTQSGYHTQVLLTVAGTLPPRIMLILSAALSFEVRGQCSDMCCSVLPTTEQFLCLALNFDMLAVACKRNNGIASQRPFSGCRQRYSDGGLVYANESPLYIERETKFEWIAESHAFWPRPAHKKLTGCLISHFVGW